MMDQLVAMISITPTGDQTTAKCTLCSFVISLNAQSVGIV